MKHTYKLVLPPSTPMSRGIEPDFLLAVIAGGCSSRLTSSPSVSSYFGASSAVILRSMAATSDYIFSLSISSLSLKNCSRTLLMKSRTQQGGRYPELKMRRMFRTKSGSMPISEKRRLNWLVSRLRRYVSQKREESGLRSFVITVD